MNNYPKTHYEITDNFFKKELSLHIDDIFKKLIIDIGDNPNYNDFSLYCMDNDILPFLVDDPYKSSITLNVFFHLYEMYVNHHRVYHVTSQMASKLINTDLNIDSYFLRSPFPEIYIQINKGLLYIQDEEGLQSISGIYVNYGINKMGEREIRVMCAALLDDTKEIPFNDSLFYFRIPLKDGKIKDVLKNYMEEQFSTPSDDMVKSGGLLNRDHIEGLFKFVMNVLLYITSKNPDIKKCLPYDFGKEIARKKNKAKANKLLKRANMSTNLPIMVLGKDLAINKDISDIRNKTGLVHWKLNQKVYVSGHWKTQWYGSHKEDNRHYKIIFIEPYEKGPDLGEVIKKEYSIGK